jgi:predicted ATP-grasp superfamily ATP-dependent carboligase
VRVLLLDGNENQTVAATRSLARHGYEVIVGASEAWSKAGWSRFASRSFRYPSPRTAAAGFIDALIREIGGDAAIVLPMTERTTLPISAHRRELQAAGALLVLPPHDVVLEVFDKARMTELARSLGIAVPQTRVVEADDDADELARTLSYPLVLKPRTSEERTDDGRIVATGAPSYARSSSELVAALGALRRRCRSVLAQEFVPGTGAGYFALLHDGEVRGEFAHRRLRDVRPSGSGSALRESVVPSPALREASLSLLGAVGWHGVAMVEFRIRPDGQPVFLEINGRFWNSLALAIHAGVDFPVAVAQMAEHGDTTCLPPGRPGVRCRWLLGDARHLVSVWKGAPPGFPVRFPSRLATTAEVLRPSRGIVHDNFSLDDPLPELGDWLHFLLRRIPGALRSKVVGALNA